MNDPFASVRAEMIGEGLVIPTPYGPRRMTYADHAASGRSYRPIERFLCEIAAPSYGNTHTETSHVGAQTTAFREEARDIIRKATRCGPNDRAIFIGNGVTGAIHTLRSCLRLNLGAEPPVVFIGPYEHHSNELPWREAPVEIEVVNECQVDGIDLDDLTARLARHNGRRLIGSFSAGSNVTGRLTNVRALARRMHDAGGVAFFDYAAAGPYVDLRMNDDLDPLAYLDAAFLSMHKFAGGPGAPGVLLAKTHLFENRIPAVPGGGTISYVSLHNHTYLQDIEHREEGGTPDIRGAIRAGLAMRLRQMACGAWPDGKPYDCLSPSYEGGTPYPGPPGSLIGTAPPEELRPGGSCDPNRPNLILAHEQDFTRRAIEAWRSDPNLTVLGDLDAPRLGISSFLVHHHAPDGRQKLLHHNFVVALLNDLFGIQARGGNSCAAPYAHRLLHVSDEDELELERAVAAGWAGAKPGWTRISFGWYDSEATLAFVIEAVRFIAAEGWRFLPDYTFDPQSGSWRVRGWNPPLLGLDAPATALPTFPEEVRPHYLAEAVLRAASLRQTGGVEPTPFEPLRWFWLPGEL